MEKDEFFIKRIRELANLSYQRDIVTFSDQSQTLKARIAVYDAKASALEDSIAGEQERTQEIDEQKEYMQTDEYIAEVARDKLGLVKGNEIVFEEEK